MRLWETVVMAFLQSGFVIGLIFVLKWIGKIRGSTESAKNEG